MRKLSLGIAVGVFCLAAGSQFGFTQTPDESNPMSFFLTSVGAGQGANFGGIEGADAHCQQLARTAGAGAKSWRAYLSNQARPGQPAIDARDRIGTGPWYNAHGVLVAENVQTLHSENNNIRKEIALDESGETVGGQGDPAHEDDKTWAYMQANPRSIRHEILTGSTAEGRAFTDGRDHTCNNWTSEEDGNSLARARFNTGPGAEIGKHDETGSWNSHGISGGCNHEGLARAHGAGLFYCFATD